MSVKRNSALKISEVLQAFFQMDGRTQQQIRDQVQRLTDPRTTKAERDRAEQTLAAMLRSAGEQDQAGRVLARRTLCCRAPRTAGANGPGRNGV